MIQKQTITTELPPSSPAERTKMKWYLLPGAILRALYGILITVLASLGATVLLNSSLREAIFSAIFRQ